MKSAKVNETAMIRLQNLTRSNFSRAMFVCRVFKNSRFVFVDINFEINDILKICLGEQKKNQIIIILQNNMEGK